jgi:hypothetical protein
MTDMLTTAVLFERVDAMDAEELDRLQAAIDRRRSHLAGDEVVPSAGPSSTVVERRAYGSGVRVGRTGTSTTARTASRRLFIWARRMPPRSCWRR